MTVRTRPATAAFSAAAALLLLASAGCITQYDAVFKNYADTLDRRSTVRFERPLTERAPVAPSGPLNMSIEEAVLVGLENNRALIAERKNPSIVQTYEDQQRAVFDPVLRADAEVSIDKARTGGGADAKTTSVALGGSVAERFPSGADVAVGVSTNRSRGDASGATAHVGLSVTQALLRGAGVDVNLASLRRAGVDTLVSQYELRGFAEALVADIESTCWDYALAKRQLEIYEKSLALAVQQLKETEERVQVGRLAETELAAARAEVALRREALINARSELDVTRLRLLRLTNPPSADLWNREIALKDAPAVPQVGPDDVEDHVRLALKMRPDLNEARLRIQRGDIDVVESRNGLLPKLDLFVSLGKTGYADSFGGAAGDLSGRYYEVSAGLGLEVPLGNRDAKARYRRAVLSQEQAADAVANLEQLIHVDVRSAAIEVKRAAEQVAATTATRTAQEEKARAESEKFRVGRTTSILVAAALRDLVESQIAEIRAVVGYLKALITLYRLDGSLLERRGISAPGREPPGPVR